LVFLIEVLQFLTASHVADPRDLLVAWACAGSGAAIASRWLAKRGDRLPSPASLLRGVVALAAVALGLRLVLCAFALTGHAWTGMDAWLPMAGSFGSSWHQMLTLYCTSLGQYIATGGLVVLWQRTRGQRPSATLIVGTVLAASAAMQAMVFWAGYPLDTSQALLALAGGIVMVRLDRALFGLREPAARAGADHPAAARRV
jgi:hypothetical protein